MPTFGRPPEANLVMSAGDEAVWGIRFVDSDNVADSLDDRIFAMAVFKWANRATIVQQAGFNDADDDGDFASFTFSADDTESIVAALAEGPVGYQIVEFVDGQRRTRVTGRIQLEPSAATIDSSGSGIAGENAQIIVVQNDFRRIITVSQRGPRGATEDLRAAIAYKRIETFLRATSVSATGKRKKVRIGICNSQSLGIGNTATKCLTPTCPFQNNLFMLELSATKGGPARPDNEQSPYVASNQFTGRLIPMHEQVGRINPNYTDPVTGLDTVMPSNTGETFMTAMFATMIQDEINDGVAPEDLSIYIGVNVGMGGQRLSHLGRGTYPYSRQVEAIQLITQICRSNNWEPEFFFIQWQGEANVAQDEAGNVTDQLTPEARAAETVQFHEWAADDLRRLVGLPLRPKRYVIQSGTTYPTQTASVPPKNGRRGTISDGDRLACKLHPDLELISSDYFLASWDGVHKLAEMYNYLGAVIGHPIGRSLTGVGKGRAIDLVEDGLLVTGSNEITAIFDCDGLPLYRLGFEAYDFHIENPGSGNSVGAVVAVNFGYRQCLIRITQVDINGGMTAGEMIHPGSHPTDPALAGTWSSVNFSPAMIVLAGGENYSNRAQVPLLGGVLKDGDGRAEKVRLITDNHGHVQRVETVLPGIYASRPPSPFTVYGGGGGANGLLLQDAVMGTPPAFSFTSLKQVGQDWAHNPLQSGQITASSGVATVGMTLTCPDGTLVEGGYAATASVMGLDPVTHVPNYIRVACGGQYLVSPDTGGVVTFVNGGVSVSCRVAIGPWPVLEPGDGGVNLTDESYPGGSADSNGVAYPQCVSFAPYDYAGIVGSSIKFLFSGAIGPWPELHLAQFPQSLEGGATGARLNICTDPVPGAPRGPFGLFHRYFPIRMSRRVVNPLGNAPVPAIDNASFAIAQDGDGPFTLTNAGVYAADRHRGYRNAIGGFIQRVAGIKRLRALRLGRTDGNSVNSAISYTHQIIGEAARRFRGLPLAYVMDIIFGGGYTPANLLFRLYSANDPNLSFGNLSIPAGVTQLMQDTVVPSSSLQRVSFSTGATLVPNDTETIYIYMQATGFAAAQAASDFFQFEGQAIGGGTEPPTYIELSEQAELDRCEQHYLKFTPYVGGSTGYVPFPRRMVRTPSSITGAGLTVTDKSVDGAALSASPAGFQQLTVNARL